MKTFASLVEEVQKPGLCHLCGGCLTFCTAINYGALEMGEDGMPYLGDMEKCIECGLCYSICPEIKEMDDDIRKIADWSEPLGKGPITGQGGFGLFFLVQFDYLVPLGLGPDLDGVARADQEHRVDVLEPCVRA